LAKKGIDPYHYRRALLAKSPRSLAVLDLAAEKSNWSNKAIQSILRHADVSTTLAYYVQPDRAAGERGLRKLSDVLQKKYKIKV